MFGRKKKKQEEPKSYLRCPYCGHAPIIVTGKCTYHNPRHTVYRYECDLAVTATNVYILEREANDD